VTAAARVGDRRDCLRASHAELGDLYAAWAADVHHVEPAVRSSRFAARLAPFRSRDEAERALLAEGAVIEMGSGAHGR
jgi:hypothetical protein